MSIRAVHNENELLVLASRSDQKAFTLLFHMYKSKLYAYILRITESEELAEDIVQDVFLKLWRDHEQLGGIDNFGSYIFRMSKNHVINHFKKMAHETLVVSEMFKQRSEGHNDIQDMIAVKDVEKVLSQIIQKLPAQQKSVYQLSREEGKTHEEIANLLNISPNTVKNHIVQAMLTIRLQLRKHANVMLVLASILSLKK